MEVKIEITKEQSERIGTCNTSTMVCPECGNQTAVMSSDFRGDAELRWCMVCNWKNYVIISRGEEDD